MKRLSVLACILLALGDGRLAAQSGNYTFDKNANFYNYRTYKWVTVENAKQLDELTEGQLIGTIELELAKKGLKKADSDQPDLYISYQIATGKDKPLTNFNIALGSGNGGSSSSAGAASTTVHSGQLVLDMVDYSKKKLVWRGVVSNPINANAKPDKRQKHMDHAVEKLLSNYPPKKTS
jgi:uncharacterized protein DUF4136